MRDELQNIERIERYLEGKMTGEEKEAFETEMANDPDLKNDVDIQKQLQDGIKRQALKAEIQKAHERFVSSGGGASGNFLTSTKFLAALAGAIIVATAAYFLVPSQQPNLVETQAEVVAIEEKAEATISDTFDNAIPSQFFNFIGERNYIAEGEDGVKVYIPIGAFVNEDGEVENGPIELELKEALDMDNMLKGNLTTTDVDGNLLESGGMLYLDARANGKKLTVNPNKPLYIEVPTKEKKPDMMIYRGYRGNNGNLIWAEPKKPENYLVTVPFDQLDFYPPEFEETVEAGMPYRTYEEAPTSLKDSLYYSLKMPVYESPKVEAIDDFEVVIVGEPRFESTNLSARQSSNGSNKDEDDDSDLDLNEAYNRGNEVVDGKYTDRSFEETRTASRRSGFNFTTRQIGEDIIELSFTIDVADGELLMLPLEAEKIYETSNSRADESPDRSTFIFGTSSTAQRVGDILIPEPKQKFLRAFRKNTRYFDQTVTFKQRFKGTNQPQTADYIFIPTKIKNGVKLNTPLSRGTQIIPALTPVEQAETTAPAKCNCINPLTIKTIRQAKYQNSFLATKEFEERLQAIFGTCRQEILEAYINNLDKNLWEVDEMASKLYNKFKNANSEKANPFSAFAEQKLTKVKDAELYADMLKESYAKDLKGFGKEVKKAEKVYQKELRKADAKVEKVKAAYRKVLVKREAQRMKTYGFRWSNTGWANVDKPVVIRSPVVKIKLPEPKPIDVKLQHTSKPDRSYVYLSLKGIKSLYRLNYDIVKQVYYPGSASTHYMIMPTNQRFYIIAVSYYGKTMHIDTLSRSTNFGGVLELSPQLKDPVSTKALLNSLSGQGRRNSISKDLDFQQKLYEEKLRRQRLRKERAFIATLSTKAFPCCTRTERLQKKSMKVSKMDISEHENLREEEGITVVMPNGTERTILKSKEPELYKKYLEGRGE